LSNASLREINYNIIIYEIRVESILKNIEKNNTKILIKINNYIYLKVVIDKTKQLIRNIQIKKYALLVIRIINAKIANKLIDKKIYYKFDIKTMQFYDTSCKIQQYLKY